MAVYKLAVIIKSSSNDEDFVLVKQTPPPRHSEEEYASYVDSDLWDLPWATLSPLVGGSKPEFVVEGAESCLNEIDLSKFDVDSALKQVFPQIGVMDKDFGQWVFWKYVHEAEFGPGPLVHMVYILGRLKSAETEVQEKYKWVSIKSVLELLSETKPNYDRVGPLVTAGLLSESALSKKWKVPQSLRFQEYPLGVNMIPMPSRTKEPFRTTNLVVIAPNIVLDNFGDSSSIIHADALIMDPGCRSDCHDELKEIVAGLPIKLIVFVTHHHYDHIDGLSVVQRCNPDAILLAHENTIRRIGKDNLAIAYQQVIGGEEINISGQRLDVIFSPGHTDGHMALLHVSTNSLIVGDHCVGHGSAVLDFRAGGNMKDYFQTTYNFLDLSPHALIPMHGRVNLWPKWMLCGYLKHRRVRELSILKAIESGAETLLEIIAASYADIDTRLWLAASSNVRLHVDHLAAQQKLPAGFSLEKFDQSFNAFMSEMGVNESSE
ncbi:hypothetical protein QJS04_geneDACA003069 [Acorus gramineus]|uniref:Metallo-beta-lactamase domain-containing protein n=1 Tax=Acorus gramineus TaxID=55184 RepID=A0AAV9BXJ4_ACOGR|nr:hypothetical protein QJS04_geneDACA003069 [Acorus gramineus]